MAAKLPEKGVHPEMSLGIEIKGPEGVVLAADSRVTIFNTIPLPSQPGKSLMLPVTYDNATKLLRVNGQDFVGAITFGLGSLQTPDGMRTIHSFLPEFEEHLGEPKRLAVADLAGRLSSFFSKLWKDTGQPDQPGEEIFFKVAGYDAGAAYGTSFGFNIPSGPKPVKIRDNGIFGMSWGGQFDIVARMILGYDPEFPSVLKDHFKLDPGGAAALNAILAARFQDAIPWAFLPLQDCVDLAVLMIESTISLQRLRTTQRGVGGLVEVATITRREGFKFVSKKSITCRCSTI